MLDWHSCQIFYPLEIKILLLSLLLLLLLLLIYTYFYLNKIKSIPLESHKMTKTLLVKTEQLRQLSFVLFSEFNRGRILRSVKAEWKDHNLILLCRMMVFILG